MTRLQLVFVTENKRSYTITIDEPVLPVNHEQINETINSILDHNLIETPNGKLVDFKAAYLVTREVQEVELN